MRDLGPDPKINAGNKQVSVPIHEARDIPQTAFSSWGLHVAKKIVRDNDVLGSESVDQFWRGGVARLPRYPFPEPGFNAGLIAFQVEHLLYFMRVQTLENRGTDQPTGAGSVNADFREIQYFL